MSRTPDRRNRLLAALAVLWVPFVFPVAAILGFLEQNSREMGPSDILPLLVLGMAIAAAVTALSYFLMRRRLVAGTILSSAFLAVFFNYALLLDTVAPRLGRLLHVRIGENDLSIILVVVIVCVAAAMFGRDTRAASAWPVVRTIAAVLLVSSLATAIWTISSMSRRVGVMRGADASVLNGPGTVADADKPDIFFIVLDTYMGTESLQELGYDNSPFLRSLQANGFQIFPNARSNYAQTYLSLASMLNAGYIDTVLSKEALAQDGGEYTRLEDIIRHSSVVGRLKSEGYSYTHIASGWNATDWAPEADKLYSSGRRSYVLTTAARTTWLAPQVDDVEAGLKQNQVLQAFDALRTEGKSSGKPRFVFAHILMPHPPYVFTAQGVPRSVPSTDTTSPKTVGAYMEQLQYTNKLVADSLPDLLNEHGRPRIVFITGDHGYWFKPPGVDTSAIPHTNRYLKVTAACYSSRGELKGVTGDSTLVNLVRSMLNEAIGARLPLLEDRSFLATPKSPLQWVEVTGALRPTVTASGD